MFTFTRNAITAAVVVAGVMLGVAPVAVAAEAPVAVTAPVIDNADLFTPSQETALAEKFAVDAGEFGLVFAVETISTLDGQSIADVAQSRANALGVGDSETNNGVFVLISRDDREVRFELGSGVSPLVSDATVNSITESDVLPHFREQDYFTGVVAGTDSIGSVFVTPSSAPDQSAFNWGSLWKWAGISVGSIIGLVVIITSIFLIVSLYRTRRAKKASQLSADRDNVIDNLVTDIRQDKLLQSLLLGAKDDKTRQTILSELFTEANIAPHQYFDTIDSMYEPFLKLYLDAEFNTIKNNYNINLYKYASPAYATQSIGQMLVEFTAVCDRELKKIEKEREQRRASQQIQREQDAKAEKKRKQFAQLQQAASEKFWKSLSSSQKAEINAAKTKKQKLAALSLYNDTPLQSDVMFPILVALYATQIGSFASESTRHNSYGSGSSSSGSSSSDSSSRNSSSSYDSGSSSSFGGGSFDGGGGGGSW